MLYRFTGDKANAHTQTKDSVAFFVTVTTKNTVMMDRYQQDDFSSPTRDSEETQYASFCRITATFIKSGSREEVNIRYRVTKIYTK